MADANKQKHDNDIIIRDQDGTYKILREGRFVPLDDSQPVPAPARAAVPVATPVAKPAPVAPPVVKPTPAPAPVKPAVKPASAPAPSQPLPNTPPVRGLADQELLSQADSIIGKSGLTFASGEIRNRVAKALVAHLKQVRKPFETRQNLMKPVADGGAGLTQNEVDSIMSAAGEAPAPNTGGVRPVTRPQNPMVKPMPSNGVAIGKEISAPAKLALDRAVSADAPYFQVTPEQARQAFSMPSVSAPRPAMADVQKPSRPIGGPVDELAYDLITWRRLATQPQDRIKKIESQLDLLEQDGYTQRLRGLTAWRSSDVVKLYLQSAKQSLEDGKPLQEMLGSGSSNQLSFEEWRAVADLNDRLTVG